MKVIILNDLLCYLKTKEKSCSVPTSPSMKCRFTFEIAVSDSVIYNIMAIRLWTAHRSVVTALTQLQIFNKYFPSQISHISGKCFKTHPIYIVKYHRNESMKPPGCLHQRKVIDIVIWNK